MSKFITLVKVMQYRGVYEAVQKTCLPTCPLPMFSVNGEVLVNSLDVAKLHHLRHDRLLEIIDCLLVLGKSEAHFSPALTGVASKRHGYRYSDSCNMNAAGFEEAMSYYIGPSRKSAILLDKECLRGMQDMAANTNWLNTPPVEGEGRFHAILELDAA